MFDVLVVVVDWTGEPLVVDAMVGRRETCLLNVGMAVMLDFTGVAVGL